MSNIQQLIQDFNDELLHFAKSMSELVPTSLIANNLDLLKQIITNNPVIVIDQFVIHVLKYKDQIEKNNERFFLDNDFTDEIDKSLAKNKELVTCGRNDIISKIFEFKDIWKTLSSENKQGIFTTMNVLCYYSEEYFMLKFSK